MMKPIASISELLPNYDAFIIDLWGVMHDGSALYPGAAEALQRIRAADKRVIFLSNAPRKAARAVAVLESLGVPRSQYDEMMTSGQAAHDMLEVAHADSTQSEWGTHYYYLGPGKDEDVIADLPYVRTDDLAQADFILNAGFEEDYQPVEEIEPVLQRLLKANLPLLCINPDLEVVKLDGTRLLCAGWVTNRYTELGGAVHYIGKPHALVYGRCFEMLGDVDADRVLAIGDNLLTDIQGANRMGIDSLLIMGGILKSEHGELLGDDALARLCEQFDAQPTYRCAAFE